MGFGFVCVQGHDLIPKEIPDPNAEKVRTEWQMLCSVSFLNCSDFAWCRRDWNSGVPIPHHQAGRCGTFLSVQIRFCGSCFWTRLQPDLRKVTTCTCNSERPCTISSFHCSSIPKIICCTISEVTKYSCFNFCSLRIGMRRRMASGQPQQFQTQTTRVLGSRRFSGLNF